jgi:hypothetical protein
LDRSALAYRAVQKSGAAAHIDAIDAAIGQIDQEVDAYVEPFRTAIEILSSIPGISDLSTEDEGQLSSGPIPTPQLATRSGQPRLTRLK